MTNMLQIQSNNYIQKGFLLQQRINIGTVEFSVAPEHGCCLKGSQCKKSDLQGLRGTVQCGNEATRTFFFHHHQPV